MSNSIDEFKDFVKKYPRLKMEVREGKRSWQSIYEEWSLLGDDGSWESYREIQENKTESSDNQEFLKSTLAYIKKINPDDITKTVGTIQKVLGIVQSLNGGNRSNQNNMNFAPCRRVDPLFRRFDDYDD